MNKFTVFAGATAAALYASVAWPAVSADEAKQLSTTLTAFGGEKGASADNAIPAYTGGLTEPPAGFDAASGNWLDPFKNEKPTLSITAKDMAQYADQLAPGVQEMLRRFPTFRVDVYPTHRTMHYPQWVLDATVKNASTAKLVGKTEGDGVEGAFGGIPFPIPKSGYEVMWNVFLNFQRTYFKNQSPAYMVDSTGSRIALPLAVQVEYRPYYDQALAGQKLPNDAYMQLYGNTLSPPTQAGIAILGFYPINYSEKDQLSWLYLPGQRRTRMSPEYKYDTPNSQYSGVLFWDELSLFSGRMDRFDFKVIGKKEMIVPYNNYRYFEATPDQLFGPKHLSPDAIRWERHRVWVVEATLKAGARHAYSKRTFLIDEDNWAITESDSFDQEGKLWRVGFSFTMNYYDGTGGVFAQAFGLTDLQKGSYFSGWVNARVVLSDKNASPNLFTPAGLAGAGVQ